MHLQWRSGLAGGYRPTMADLMMLDRAEALREAAARALAAGPLPVLLMVRK